MLLPKNEQNDTKQRSMSEQNTAAAIFNPTNSSQIVHQYFYACSKQITNGNTKPTLLN